MVRFHNVGDPYNIEKHLDEGAGSSPAHPLLMFMLDCSSEVEPLADN